MTPVLPNPPPSPFDKLLDRKDHHDFQQFDHNHHHHHLCLSSHDNQLSCDDQRLIQFQASQQQHQFKVDQYSSHHRSSEVQVFSSSSSHQANINNGCKREVIGDGSSTSENGSSPKWMPSKIRLMQKMMNTNCTSTRTTESDKIMKKLEYQFQESNEIINSLNNNKSTVRVCSDCNTTTTPLWRSGPRGPKTLCNACGIRQRKVRRAMEAAAAAGNATTAATIDTGSTKIKIQHNKEKKSRTSHIVGQYKKQCKPQDPPADQIISQRNLCFKDFALSLSKNSSALKQVFPQDVEEAAILLMELSCGFIQS